MPASASYGLDIRRFLPGGDRTRPALDAAKISAQFEDLMGSLPSPPPAPAVSRASTVGVDGGRISGDEGSESRPQKKQGARERRAQRRAQRRQQRVARHAATTAMGRPGITDAPPAFTARQHVRAVQEQFDAQLNHVGSRTAGGEGAEERGRRQGNVPASTGSQPPENMPIMRAIVTKQFERPDELVRAIEASLPASAELAQCRRRRERELEEEEEMDSALGGFIVDGDDEQPRSGRRATLIKRGDGYHSGSDDGYDSSSSSSSDDSGSSMSSSDQESAKSDVDADECETEQQEEGKDQEKQAGLHNQQHEDGSEDEAEAELEVERPLIQERLAAVIAAAPPTPSRVVQQLQAAEEERKNRQREESESASESEQAVKGDAADESDTEAAIPSQRRRRPVRQQRRVMRVVRRARLRASAERESTGVGQVEVGELVAVLGSAISSDGVERVRTRRGWASVVSARGNVLLEEVVVDQRPGLDVGDLDLDEGLDEGLALTSTRSSDVTSRKKRPRRAQMAAAVVCTPDSDSEDAEAAPATEARGMSEGSGDELAVRRRPKRQRGCARG